MSVVYHYVVEFERENKWCTFGGAVVVDRVVQTLLDYQQLVELIAKSNDVAVDDMDVKTLSRL